MTDHKRNARDPITAQLWNSVVDRLPSSFSGSGNSITDVSRVLAAVTNNTGGDLELGQFVTVNSYDGPDDKYDAGQGSYGVITPVWHSRTDKLLITAEPIPDGEIGLAVVSGHAILNCPDGSGFWAAPDPTDPGKGKRGGGGPCHVLGAISGADYLVDLGRGSALWRYELTQDSQQPERTTARLINPEGGIFAESINLTDVTKTTAAQKSGDGGLCVKVDNEFYAIETGNGQTVTGIYQAPAGGIPAAVGSTLGKADCQAFEIINDVRTEIANETRTVYNQSATPVGANAFIHATADRNGDLCVTWEDCE